MLKGSRAAGAGLVRQTGLSGAPRASCAYRLPVRLGEMRVLILQLWGGVKTVHF